MDAEFDVAAAVTAYREQGGGEAADWDERYAVGEQIWSGAPNGALVAEVGAEPPGRALDVGCGEGADAVWLAGRGWQVTALDVSGVALARAARHADAAGVNVRWVHAGLLDAAIEPATFDLVSAQYPALLRTADRRAERGLADAVAPGGVLLVGASRLRSGRTASTTASTRRTTSVRPTWPPSSMTAGRSRSTRSAIAPSAAAAARTTCATSCCARGACTDRRGRRTRPRRVRVGSRPSGRAGRAVCQPHESRVHHAAPSGEGLGHGCRGIGHRRRVVGCRGARRDSLAAPADAGSRIGTGVHR